MDLCDILIKIMYKKQLFDRVENFKGILASFKFYNNMLITVTTAIVIFFVAPFPFTFYL